MESLIAETKETDMLTGGVSEMAYLNSGFSISPKNSLFSPIPIHPIRPHSP